MEMSCTSRQCGQSTFMVPVHAACRVFGQMKNSAAMTKLPGDRRRERARSLSHRRPYAVAGDRRKLDMPRRCASPSLALVAESCLENWKSLGVTLRGPLLAFPNSVQLFGSHELLRKVDNFGIMRQSSSGRSDRRMRGTTGSQARFSSRGYTRSKQWMAPPASAEKLQRL